MKLVENHKISSSNPRGDKKTLGDFFPFVEALVNRVIRYGTGHHNYQLLFFEVFHGSYDNFCSLITAARLEYDDCEMGNISYHLSSVFLHMACPYYHSS